MIGIDDLTILTGWAEAVAEALAHAPTRAKTVLSTARPGASWRSELGLEEPSRRLSEAIESMERTLGRTAPPAETPSLDALLLLVRDAQPGESAIDSIARGVLLSTVEQLCTRIAEEADPPYRTSPSM